jgi:hypothetical protein
MTTSTGDNHAPYTVAIVAMGPSHKDYLSQCISKSGRFQVADETWVIVPIMPYYAWAVPGEKSV